MLIPPVPLLLKEGLTQGVKGIGRAWMWMQKAEPEFRRNLVDWCMGGPTERCGWTRTGPPLETPECKLVGVKRELVDADECFAKNPAEVRRWHVGFLQAYRSGADLHATPYWLEYLLPRFSREVAEQRAARFIALYESIASGGCRPGSYVWLADLAADRGLQAYFGFRYFRFDGAHRLACQYVLGTRQIPCLVFSCERLARAA